MPVPEGMAAVMATILWILAGFLDQALAVDLLIGRRGRLGLHLRAGRHVELDDAVILVGRLFRRLVALALLGHDMDEEWTVLRVADVLQHRQQMIDVVTVDRADIEEAEFVEQRAAGDEAAGVFFDGDRALLQHPAGKAFRDLPNHVAQAAIGAA